MWDFLTYFLIEGFSVLAILICAVFIGSKINPIKWKVFGLYYFLSTGIELVGHFLGWWTWTNIFHILHHSLWWATVLTLDHYWFQKTSKKVRFLILFNGIMTYQLLQQWLTSDTFVDHYPLWGSPYNMVTLVSALVCIGCIAMSYIKTKIN